MYIYYDSGIVGMVYTANGTSSTYYFDRNIKGDVIGIYNSSGTRIANVSLHSWGNCTPKTLVSNNFSTYNPIRYRGYYYDRETRLYYLNARYYDPAWRRFISPDNTAYLDPDTPSGLNLYAYCNNDPVNYADSSGHSAILVALLVGAIVGGAIGGVYGGLTAAANDQNVLVGVLIGMGAGALMGAGAGVASVYLAPVIVGQAAIVGGVTYSAGAALAIGSGIAFGSGFIGGMAADALTQIANDGGVNDWGSVFVSGVQWGFINTASAFLGSLGGPVSTLDSALLSSVFGSVTSAVGMTIDILRNRKNQKKKSYVNNKLYAYGF